MSGEEGSGTRTPADGGGRKKKKKSAAATGGKKSRKIRSKSEISDSEEEMKDGDESEAGLSADGSRSGDGEIEEKVDEEVIRAQKAKSALALLKAKAKVSNTECLSNSSTISDQTEKEIKS